MASPKLYINEKAPKKDGSVAIYVLIHLGGKSIKINTKVSAKPENIDFKRRKIKGNNPSVKDDNLIIESCFSRINEIQVRYRLQQKELTPDLLIREYKTPTFYIDFFDWMDKRISERVKQKEITASSEKTQRQCLNRLKKYKAALSFAEIDLKFIRGFKNYCRTSLNIGINTTSKTLDTFQTYLNIARRDEIIQYNPFDNFSFQGTEPTRVFLTEKELQLLTKLYDKESLPNHLQRTLRHFLFMSFTSLRISDFIRLKPHHVQENVLKFVPFKTRNKKQQELHIPLVSKAKMLMYDENPVTSFLFDSISEQKMNEQLKDIVKKTSIKKKITNHSARHTFATLFLSKTNDVATLQKIMGHSRISETMVYVHIITQKIDEQMQNFDRLLKL